MIFSEKDSRTNMIFCQLNLDAFTLAGEPVLFIFARGLILIYFFSYLVQQSQPCQYAKIIRVEQHYRSVVLFLEA